MRTAGNKLYLGGFGKQGWGKDAGSILKGGDILKGNIKKNLYGEAAIKTTTETRDGFGR